jgi:hypothetical protein
MVNLFLTVCPEAFVARKPNTDRASLTVLPDVIAAREQGFFMSEFMDENALATRLGVTCRTLRRWHVMRIGPPRTTCGRKILYKISSVMDWLVSREEKLTTRRAR